MEDKSKIFLKQQAEKAAQLKIEEATKKAKQSVAERIANIFWGKDDSSIN